MDKKTLNNEIVLCRAAVRKAKVAVIRKIVKKMKILKTCKIEGVKEKKLRKSERLFQKIQIMKKIKVDEVTKFALRKCDLEPFLQGPKIELKQNALACLAKHDAVVKKINSIREQIPNWETELPLLLDSLGRKNKKRLSSKKDSIKSDSTIDKQNEKLVKKGECNRVSPKEKTTKPNKQTCRKFDTITTASTTDNSVQSAESDNSTEDSLNSSEKLDQEVKKIVDPFFIGKKVIAPKLTLRSLPDRKSEEKVNRLREPKSKKESSFPFDREKSVGSGRLTTKVHKEVAEAESLHPSWLAKKVKLIKPFQGKKIKFSDD